MSVPVSMRCSTHTYIAGLIQCVKGRGGGLYRYEGREMLTLAVYMIVDE